MTPPFVLVTLFLVIAILWMVRELIRHGKQPWHKQRKTLLWLTIAVLLLLAITKKLHVLGLLLAGLIPLGQRLMPLLLRYGPSLHKYYTQQTHRRQNHEQAQHSNTDQHESWQHQRRTASSGTMSEDEAWEILGLRPGASKAEILARHKQLIQKLHPDRGGSNYLTARINQARDLLLKGL